MTLQFPEQERPALVAQLFQVAPRTHRAGGAALRREIDPAFRRALHIVGGLRQQLRRIEIQRADRLALGVAHDHCRGCCVVRLKRADQQQAFAQAREVRLIVPLARMRREDLALGKEHLGRERSLQIVRRRGGVEDEWTGRVQRWRGRTMQNCGCHHCQENPFAPTPLERFYEVRYGRNGVHWSRKHRKWTECVHISPFGIQGLTR